MNYTEQEKIIHHSQIGFMPGNRTADHILTLKTIHDKYVKQHSNEKIYACFVDFKKAFDSIWHDGLFLKLLENKIGGRFYDLIKDLYTNTRCAVKISDHRTSLFPYRNAGPFLTYKLGGGGKCPPCAPPPPQNHILPPQEKSLFPKSKVSFRLCLCLTKSI